MREPIPSKAREQAHTCPPGEVKTYIGLTPVECVKQGLPISEAAYMKPMDLTKADGALLLECGCTKQDIKRLYSFKHDAALYSRLKVLGLHPWPPPEDQAPELNTNKFQEEPAAESQPDIPPETAAIIEAVETGTVSDPTLEELPELITKVASLEEPVNVGGEDLLGELPEAIGSYLSTEDGNLDYQTLYPDYTWYDGSLKQTDQFLTVFGDGRFSLSNGIRRIFQGYLVAIGLSPDRMHAVIVPNEDSAYLIKLEKSRYRNPYLSESLASSGIPLPAKYQMSWNESRAVWEGTLVNNGEDALYDYQG
ncbi:hypothetical protein [Sporomusa aerivorans]|uniref:hypothetical protein n=1 Tax=Sporomusa aerivorans TaxID=204936 RepID=UPI00352A6656